MGRYVKSISDTRKLNKSLNDLKEEFSYHRLAIEKNSKELSKVNEVAEVERQKEIKQLAEKLKKWETQTQWVKNNEPAVNIDSNHMLKKLDIL